MTEPVYSEATERMYLRLPEFYRTDDTSREYQLKTFLSAVGDHLGDLETILSRIGMAPPGYEPTNYGTTSDLVDPDTADEGWLAWLGQLIGLDIPAWLGATESRALLKSRPFFPGSKPAMIAAAQIALVGDKFVAIHDHSSSLATLGTDSEWDVLVVTKTSENAENLLTDGQATFSTGGKWVASPSVETKQVISVPVEYDLYKNRVLEIQNESGGGADTELRPNNNFKVACAPSDVMSFVCHWATDLGGFTGAGKFWIEWLNAASTVIGTSTLGDATTVVVGTNVRRVAVSATAPALTAFARPMISTQFIFTPAFKLWVAQAGFYEGHVQGWTEFSGDPVAAIEAAGQKPAGVVLHQENVDSSWTGLEADYPNWTAIEATDWDRLEEAE